MENKKGSPALEVSDTEMPFDAELPSDTGGLPGIEETFRLLDGLLEHLEREELTLEESFAAYAKGLELVKHCRQSIDEVEKKVLFLEESGELHEF